MARKSSRSLFPARDAMREFAQQMRENPRRRASVSPRALRALTVANPFAYESQLVDTDAGWGFKQNPAGRTISARREGTCPITGDAIHPGDSITKTDEGWALTEHVHENPKRVARYHAPQALSQPMLRDIRKMMPDVPMARLQSMSLEEIVNEMDRRGVMHPELEGYAMRLFARENPRTFPGGMSRSQKNIRTAKKISRHEDVFEGIGLADVMSRARPGSRSAREAKAELAGANRRKRRAFGKAQSNPAKEMQVQAIAQEILRAWPTINPNAEPALFFMLHPNYITGGDTIDHVVGSFLANATTWRGESARRIKAQLNALLR